MLLGSPRPGNPQFKARGSGMLGPHVQIPRPSLHWCGKGREPRLCSAGPGTLCVHMPVAWGSALTSKGL